MARQPACCRVHPECRRLLRRADFSAGFTLTELIGVMLIVGVLAVLVLPRFADQSYYTSRGLYDRTLAVLRYAQKVAIAQRRSVCVYFASNAATTSITLKVANNAASAVDCTDSSKVTNLTGPDGSNPYRISVSTSSAKFTDSSGNALTPTNFYFTALGQANVGQTFRVSGFSFDITIEQETGYVHS